MAKGDLNRVNRAAEALEDQGNDSRDARLQLESMRKHKETKVIHSFSFQS